MTFFIFISIGFSLFNSKVLSFSSFKSKNLNIFLLAVIPFIATWKREVNRLKGKKNSKDNNIITIACPKLILFILYSDKAMDIPNEAPPYVIKSIKPIEFNCITKTFIVSFLNFSA